MGRWQQAVGAATRLMRCPLRHLVTVFVAGLLVSLVAAGCAGGGTGGSGAGTPLPKATTFLASRNTPIGPVLVDPDGRTLYVNVTETDGRSTCDASCAVNWPPVSAELGLAPQADATIFRALTRSDGTTQLTVRDLPAYRSARDRGPGDLLGQGLAGVWFAIAPDGHPIQRAVDEMAASTTTTTAPTTTTTTPTAQVSGRAVLTTGDGFTLYVFALDVVGQPSRCVDPCATTWSVVPPETVVVRTVDRARFSTIVRTDGSPQLALDGRPVYRFRGDRPGTADGHRFGGVWFAIAADGSVIS